jgi:nucleotide-binding universal stress UspA family protein
MAEGKDYLGEKLRLVERAREDAYFRKLDQELIAKMRQKATVDAEESGQLAQAFDTILVPVDFSSYAARALLYAADIAERFGSSIIVLHVIGRDAEVQAAQQRLQERGITLPGSAVQSGPPEISDTVLADIVAAQREQVYKELFEFLPPRLAKYPLEVRVVMGNPFERIVETAVQSQVALIVMGTHGRTGLSRVVMGSIAERVTRLAPCPVLLVKAATSEDESWLQSFYKTFIPSSTQSGPGSTVL